MKRIFVILILAVAIVAVFSCKKDNSYEKLRKNELALLDTYIQENYKDSVPRPSGLYYFEVAEGTGDSTIVPGDRVQIFYAVWTIDSLLKDETNGYTDGYRYEPLEFTVKPAGQLSSSSATTLDETPGLHEAITYMKNGTVADLIMPSEIAYGQNGNIYYGISGFETLLVHVEVYKIFRGGTSAQ